MRGRNVAPTAKRGGILYVHIYIYVCILNIYIQFIDIVNCMKSFYVISLRFIYELQEIAMIIRMNNKVM